MLKKLALLTLLPPMLYANMESDFVTDVAKTALMGSQRSFESGSHDLQAHEEMWSLFAAFRYNFDSSSDWNLFANGAVGFSSFETNNPLAGTVGDHAELDAINIEVGGGVRYKINTASYIALGGGVIYSQVEPSFSYNNAATLLNQSTIDALYNSSDTLDVYTYQVNVKYDYETQIAGYEPYVTAFMGYYYTDVDGLDETSSSTLAHIKGGVYSPELVKVFNLPFKVELYAQESFVMGDLEENMDVSNFTTVGMAFHLYTNTIVPLLDNVFFDMNYVTGDNIEGWHVGLSASF